VAGVIIGVDPHKGSHTAVALDEHENKLGQLRVRATPAQVEQLRRWAATWPNRTWPIEGARGLGRLLAQQLIGTGEQVVDVQPSSPPGSGCRTPDRSPRTTATTLAQSRWPRYAPTQRVQS
jgi:hypothetical protein